MLKAVGELSREPENSLNAMAPKLQASTGAADGGMTPSPWALHMPGTMPKAVRDMASPEVRSRQDQTCRKEKAGFKVHIAIGYQAFGRW